MHFLGRNAHLDFWTARPACNDPPDTRMWNNQPPRYTEILMAMEQNAVEWVRQISSGSDRKCDRFSHPHRSNKPNKFAGGPVLAPLGREQKRSNPMQPPSRPRFALEFHAGSPGPKPRNICLNSQARILNPSGLSDEAGQVIISYLRRNT